MPQQAGQGLVAGDVGRDARDARDIVGHVFRSQAKPSRAIY